jgi:uncharacterized membrane protein YhhN
MEQRIGLQGAMPTMPRPIHKELHKEMDKETLQIRSGAAIAAVLALVELYFEFSGNQAGIFFAKPLAMLVIMVQPALIGLGLVNSYQKSILVGMMASIVGDVFLMLPGNYFLLGLGAFLVAHLIYTYGFIADREDRIQWISVLPYLGLAALTFGFFWWFGDVEPVMLAPVGLYILAICTMTWQAFDRLKPLSNGKRKFAGYAAIGASLFLISDFVLAFNRFVAPFEYASVVVMATYLGAQYMIAKSAFRFPRKRF